MKAFSFSLYGPPRAKYYTGLLENIELIQKHFSDWKIFIYTGNDVPSDFVGRLQNTPQCIVIPCPTSGAAMMMPRFYTIDYPEVEVMMVRDADSRIHERDRWTIREFLRSPKTFHIIRDHPHHNIQIVGGFWGMKKGALDKPMKQLAEEFTKTNQTFVYGYDQEFLRQMVYPRLNKKNVLVHTSIPYPLDEEVVVIPFPIQNHDFIGQVIDYKLDMSYKLYRHSN